MAASLSLQLSLNERAFESQLISYMKHFKLFESQANQREALARIPLDDLKAIAQAKFDSTAEEMKPSSSVKDDDVVRDMLLMEIMDWFKNDFFSWMNSPPCPRCKKPTTGIGSGNPTPHELAMSAIRLELFTCTSCFTDKREVARFPRYNDPVVLLNTRTGRCGEWANCFALICRAAGYEVRHIHDHTDHVWVEVFSSSLSPNRWVHVDPCENSFDNPLLYEVGWGKKLTYIIAVSQDDLQDVTPRYSKDFKKILARRKGVGEPWLANTIVQLRKGMQANLPESRKAELQKRWIEEIVELLSDNKNTKESEKVGRESGSLAWRLARQELGDPAGTTLQEYVWKVDKECVIEDKFVLFYDCESDTYQSRNGDIWRRGWQNGTQTQSDIFRKEELDWKMVYLAPKENSMPQACSISWKFEVDPEFELQDVNVKVKYSIFQQDAQFSVLVETDKMEKKTLLETNAGDQVFSWESDKANNISQLKSSKTLTLTCDLRSGSGNDGWQKVQLFRQHVSGRKSIPSFDQCVFWVEFKVKKS